MNDQFANRVLRVESSNVWRADVPLAMRQRLPMKLNRTDAQIKQLPSARVVLSNIEFERLPIERKLDELERVAQREIEKLIPHQRRASRFVMIESNRRHILNHLNVGGVQKVQLWYLLNMQQRFYLIFQQCRKRKANFERVSSQFSEEKEVSIYFALFFVFFFFQLSSPPLVKIASSLPPRDLLSISYSHKNHQSVKSVEKRKQMLFFYFFTVCVIAGDCFATDSPVNK